LILYIFPDKPTPQNKGIEQVEGIFSGAFLQRKLITRILSLFCQETSDKIPAFL
jgi:hypothetical protein